MIGTCRQPCRCPRCQHQRHERTRERERARRGRADREVVDGNVTLMSNVTLTRDTEYAGDLDLNGYTFDTNGHRFIVRGTLSYGPRMAAR